MGKKESTERLPPHVEVASPTARLIYGCIAKAAAREVFGITTEALLLPELRKRRRVPDHLNHPYTLGRTLSELGFRTAGYITHNGHTAPLHVYIPDDATMTEEDVQELIEDRIEAAKAIWRITRKPHKPALNMQARVALRNLQRAAAMQQVDNALILQFDTPNEAIQCLKALERFVKLSESS